MPKPMTQRWFPFLSTSRKTGTIHLSTAGLNICLASRGDLLRAGIALKVQERMANAASESARLMIESCNGDGIAIQPAMVSEALLNIEAGTTAPA